MDRFSATDAGIIVIGVILILREVFGFIAKRKNGARHRVCDDCVEGIKAIAKQTDDLYRWHDVRDNEGVPIWYVRKSLEKAINKLADNVEKQTVAIREQNTLLERNQRPA